MEYLLGVCNSSNKSTINCWNCVTGNTEHIYSSEYKPVTNSLCMLKNDYILIAEVDKPLLHLWSMNSQESKLRLILPGKAEAVCIDNSCTYLFVAIGVSVYIWMISSGDLLVILEQHNQPISCIKVSNNEHIIIAGNDGTLTTYNFNDVISKTTNKDGEPLYVISDHTNAITDLDIGSFGSRSRLVSVSLDQSCRVYDLQSGDPLTYFTFTYPLTSVTLNATISWNIYVGDANGNINAIEIQGDIIEKHIENRQTVFKGHSKKIISISINVCNNLLATASEDCSIIIWDLKSRKQTRIFKQELPSSGLLFIPAHSNIHLKTFTPKLQIIGLKKTPINDFADLEVFIVQNDNIEFDDDRKSEIVGGLNNTNSNDADHLRVVNKQLYDMVNMLIKKIYGPS